MIVLIDNYDSFTYTLVQRIGELDARLDTKVFRDDQNKIAQMQARLPDHFIT